MSAFGFERVEERPGLGEYVFGFGGGERPAENAMRGELGSAFGVAGDQLHEHAGIDFGVGECVCAAFLRDGEA